MKKVLLLISVVAILTMVAAPAALACGGHGGKGMGHAMVLCPCMKEKLALTDDQVKKVEALKEAFHKKMAPAMKKIKAKKEEMMKLWMAAKPSRKAILAKKAQMRKIKMKMNTAKVDVRLKMLKILTADQKKKMAEVMKTCATDCKGMGKGCPEGCTCPKCKGGCPEGCTCPKCKGAKACPEGCTCPKCAKKAETKPAPKKGGCEGCPGDCGHKH
jgi:Spy/CpxP family protein refolding chaperone